MYKTVKSFFEQTMPLAYFSAFRMVFFSWYLFQSLRVRSEEFFDIQSRPYYNPIPLFEWGGLGRIAPPVFEIVFYLMVIATLFVIEGRWARWALPVVAITSFVKIGTTLGFYKSAANPYVPHSQNILMYFLILFCLVPARHHQSARQALLQLRQIFTNPTAPTYATIPIVSLLPFKLSLAVIYFGAAFIRFKKNGFNWLDGYTLQGYLYDRYYLVDIQSALLLAKNHDLSQRVSVAFNFFELLFPLTCLNRYLFLPAALLAMTSHFLILYFMGINFLNWHLMNFSVILPELLCLALYIKQKAHLV